MGIHKPVPQLFGRNNLSFLKHWHIIKGFTRMRQKEIHFCSRERIDFFFLSLFQKNNDENEQYMQNLLIRKFYFIDHNKFDDREYDKIYFEKILFLKRWFTSIHKRSRISRYRNEQRLHIFKKKMK